MTYRKIGGIHWLALGRLRISWCLKRDASRDASTSTLGRKLVSYQPTAHWTDRIPGDTIDWGGLAVISAGLAIACMFI